MNRAAVGVAAGLAVLLGAGGILLRAQHAALDGPEIGGSFRLTDGDGRRVTERDFHGRWQLVYFGYTHCPDVCPTTLGDIGAALDRLTPAERANMRVLFVTVDPARDTPPVMGAYAKAFGPAFVGLTGTPAEVAAIEDGFRVYARRHELKGGDYAMDHSSIIYVMRPDGGFAGLLDDGTPPPEMARRLAQMGA